MKTEVDKDHEEKGQRIQLNMLHRVGMITCLIVQVILFAYFQALLFHYIYMPMPSLFSASSLLNSPHM